MLGCHAIHTKGDEKYPFNYPLEDGQSCLCYNRDGVRCVASCAANVVDHEVRHQYGTRTVTVTCSPGNFVLGCGVKPKKPSNGRFEKWRTWSVKTPDSCECYDYHGATCYAVCGRFA